jgi:hypothetical protein
MFFLDISCFFLVIPRCIHSHFFLYPDSEQGSATLKSKKTRRNTKFLYFEKILLNDKKDGGYNTQEPVNYRELKTKIGISILFGQIISGLSAGI